MKIALTYSIVPNQQAASSLHLQYDQNQDSRARLWLHFGGLSADANAESPWWMSYGEATTASEHLNQATTNIILNLIKDLKIEAVPDFEVGLEGTAYELEFLAGFNRVKYVWSGDLPQQWQRFSPLLGLLGGFLEARKV